MEVKATFTTERYSFIENVKMNTDFSYICALYRTASGMKERIKTFFSREKSFDILEEFLNLRIPTYQPITFEITIRTDSSCESVILSYREALEYLENHKREEE